MCKTAARRSSADSVDGFTAGFPTEIGLDGRTAMVAVAMNGEPLPAEHGFPARLVVAGLYGYVSATKWLDSIDLVTWEDFDGYWVPRGWSKEGPIKIASRIDVPTQRGDHRRRPAGRSPAWRGSPTLGIATVEVQVDDGPWTAGALGDATSDNTWVQWYVPWDAHVGRAQDPGAGDEHQAGETQTEHRADPAPDGATGWHTPHGSGPLTRRSRAPVDPGALLDWGAPRLRDLPWRATRDPWRILVAEVMLQQTQVPRVIPKWLAFCAAYPTPAACAAAPLGDVLRHWQGLGYPRRARNLGDGRRRRRAPRRRAARRPRRAARAAWHRALHGACRAGVRVRARRRRRRHQHRSRAGAGRRRAAHAVARSRSPTRSCRAAPGGRGTRC